MSMASQGSEMALRKSTEKTQEELHKIEIKKGVPGKSMAITRGRPGGKFNLSMQFNSGEMMKFERHVNDFFCDGLDTTKNSIIIKRTESKESPRNIPFSLNQTEDLVRLGSKEQGTRIGDP